MKPRIWTTLLVLFVLLAFALIGRTFLPVPFLPSVCWELLLALCIYYAMRREAVFSGIAAFCCGILEEGLCLLPAGFAMLFFLGSALLCHNVLRPQMNESCFSCAIVGAAVFPVWTLFEYIVLRLFTDFTPLPFFFVLGRIALAIPLGFVAAGLTALVSHRLDWISANVDLDNDDRFGYDFSD